MYSFFFFFLNSDHLPRKNNSLKYVCHQLRQVAAITWRRLASQVVTDIREKMLHFVKFFVLLIFPGIITQPSHLCECGGLFFTQNGK